MNAPESITIRPDPASWHLGSARGEYATHEQIVRFREELELPSGPIVMSGHQAEWWHPGILAKYFASAAFAARSNAAFVWLVVDQDTGTPESMRYPGESWIPKITRFESEVDELRPLCERKPLAPKRESAGALCPSVGRTLDSVIDSLNKHVATANLARQMTAAIREHLPKGQPEARFIFASDVAKTTLFSKLVCDMKEDAAACAKCYNAAVDACPEAKVRRLREGADPELPLWMLNADGMRSAARVSTLGGRILPRALAMTAIVRAAGCELFVHGLGGGLYDRMTEHWMRLWKGVSLAPMAVVSATRYPRPSDAPRVVTSAEAIDALASAHRAWHHPIVLGDIDAQAWRDDIVRRIARETMPTKNALYHTLQTWLKAYRERHEPELQQRFASARELQIAARSGRGAFDRTWPFFFLHTNQIEQLRLEFERAFDCRGGV